MKKFDICDNLDCVLCLTYKHQRLVRLYEMAKRRANRRYGGGSMWLDAIDLRTNLARLRISAAVAMDNAYDAETDWLRS